MRSRTEQPYPRRAEVEILGVAFCGACAREQEAYFAIGELTDERARDLRSKTLAGVEARIGQDADEHRVSRSLGRGSESLLGPQKPVGLTPEERISLHATRLLYRGASVIYAAEQLAAEVIPTRVRRLSTRALAALQRRYTHDPAKSFCRLFLRRRWVNKVLCLRHRGSPGAEEPCAVAQVVGGDSG